MRRGQHRETRRKKGQVGPSMNMLVLAGISIVAVVVMVAVGAQLVGEVREIQLKDVRKTISNEQITPTCTANASTAFPEGSNTVNCTTTLNTSLVHNVIVSGSITDVVNATGGDTVPTTSFRQWNNPSGFELINNSWNNTQINVSYQIDTQEETLEHNISITGQDSFGTFADFFSVIIIVVVAFVVITLLLSGIGRNRI